jgi:ankyrin repeat protein
LKQEYIIVSSTTNNNIMSQAEIDAIVTPEGVATAVARGISVNARGEWGATALLRIVLWKLRRELVVALLAVGANPNVTDDYGRTSVWAGAYDSTADILQLLIDGGGSVNEPTNFLRRTPLIALARNNGGDAPARLQILLACPELNLEAICERKTAEEWAVRRGHPELAAAIAEERRRRERWSTVRCAWVAATARSWTLPMFAYSTTQ